MSDLVQTLAMETLFPHDQNWQQLCDKLRATSTL